MNLVWSEQAADYLSKIYEYILSESPENAIIFIDEIITLSESLLDKSFEYPIDPIINKLKFRHICIWSYKVIYEKTII